MNKEDKQTVLVVDDSEPNIFILESTLEFVPVEVKARIEAKTTTCCFI